MKRIAVSLVVSAVAVLGGAVFSAGSIAFLGSLSHNGYRNTVSRLVANVLDGFRRR